MKTTKEKINFGEYLHQLRMKHQLPQKVVADKLGIDISLLSKIEHGERFVQAHMLAGIAEMFELSYRDLQIQFLCTTLKKNFGTEPFFREAIALLNQSSGTQEKH